MLFRSKECFNIKTDNEIEKYSLTFISKTKNIKAELIRDNNEKKIKEINEESNNIIFGKEYNRLCLSRIGEAGSQKSNEEDAGVFFQLISVKENPDSPKMNLTLIKGVSTLQALSKGQYIYYRINEYSPNSNFININFQKIKGNPEVKISHCKNFPECDFSNDEKLDRYFLNNIYYNYKITPGEDIYHKADFPVVIVHCPNVNGNEEGDCNYYIQMSNENDTKLLNKDNKIYSYIQDDGVQTYKIDKSTNDKVYLQIRTLTGEVNMQSSEKDNYEYNNNTKFLLFNEDSKDIYININGTKNSLYNIYYYSENDTIFYLSNGEVQYNIISNTEEKNYYFYHKHAENIKSQYLVSVNAINCYLLINQERKRYYQSIIKNNSSLPIKWDAKELSVNENDKCEFTISSSEIINGNPKELIINDGIYYYYSLNNDGLNSVTLKYLFSKNEDKKNILININKKSDKELNVEYQFKSKNNKESRIIKKYNDLFYINYENKNDNSELAYYDDAVEYLIINITSSDQIDFRINVNGRKNMPIYLDPEEIEFGIIPKGEKLFYYFDNYNLNEQVYLHSKGTAKIQYIRKYDKTKINKIPDVDVSHIDNDGIDNFKNYFNFNSTNYCSEGCRVYFCIYLDANERNENSDYNLFNVYRHSNQRLLNIPENTNIYGYFNGKLDKEHSFISKPEFNKLKITLNCLNCIMSSEDKNQKKIKIANTSIIEVDSKNEFVYNISSSIEGYYYFSFTYIDSNKYIDQLEPERECLFTLPLHRYYMYNQNDIILFVPDYEEAVISIKFCDMNEYENNTLDNNIRDKDYDDTSSKKHITNRLFVDISNHSNENKYLLIKVSREDEESFCTLIISQFYNSLNSLNIQYIEKIYRSNNELKQSSFDFSTYKFDLMLLNGSGSVSFILDNGEEYKYGLSYDNRESMSLIMKMKQNSSMIMHEENENFIYYLNMTKKDDQNEEKNELVHQKVNTFKYFKDISKITNKILFRKEDLIINFRLSDLVKNENDSDVSNSEKEKFKFKIFGIKPSKREEAITKVFYSKSLRRGYIYLNYTDIQSSYENFNHYELEIDITNKKIKRLFLEITPLYIDKSKDFNVPRNAYLQMDVLSEEYTFSFVKPNDDYKNLKIELANSTDIIKLSLNGQEKNYSDFEGFGKKYLYFDNEKEENIIKIKFSEKGSILLKNALENKDKYKFTLNETYATVKKIMTDSENNKDNNTYHISHSNIKIEGNNTTNPDYRVAYLIRLFNILDYYDQDEIDNILFPNDVSQKSFRKELNEDEKQKNEISYDVTLGELTNAQYYLSIIAEVTYNDNVEYFTFNSEGDELRIIEPREYSFDYTWVYVLVILVLILIVIIAYLVRHYINSKKEVKNEIIDDKKQFLMNKADN